jgi:hypothetical protein
MQHLIGTPGMFILMLAIFFGDVLFRRYSIRNWRGER